MSTAPYRVLERAPDRFGSAPHHVCDVPELFEHRQSEFLVDGVVFRDKDLRPGSVTRFGGSDSARVAGLHNPFSHHANASSYNGSD